MQDAKKFVQRLVMFHISLCVPVCLTICHISKGNAHFFSLADAFAVKTALAGKMDINSN